MVIDWIRYPGRGRDYRGYVVRPRVALTAPAVLLLPDRWGLSPQAKRRADALAHQGYVVMVPDIYDGHVPQDEEDARHRMQLLTHRDGLDRVITAVHWLRNQAYTKAHRTAVIGFGELGAFALHAGTETVFPPVAIVLFATPVARALDLVPQLRSAVQAHFSKGDPHVALQDVQKFQEALHRHGISGEVHLYDAPVQDLLSSDASEASPEMALAWERTLTFLQSHFSG